MCGGPRATFLRARASFCGNPRNPRDPGPPPGPYRPLFKCGCAFLPGRSLGGQNAVPAVKYLKSYFFSAEKCPEFLKKKKKVRISACPRGSGPGFWESGNSGNSAQIPAESGISGRGFGRFGEFWDSGNPGFGNSGFFWNSGNFGFGGFGEFGILGIPVLGDF